MRTYSAFLLFEEVLDFAPQGDIKLYQFIKDVINPRVKVISANCLTTTGSTVNVTYEIEGLIELSTNVPITRARIDVLLAAGTYFTSTRALYSCVATGGICTRCYNGTYLDMTTPTVGSTIRLMAEYNYLIDVFTCNGVLTTYTLTEPTANYTKALVIIDGVIQTSGYTIVNQTLTMSVAPTLGKHIVVRYYHTTAQPYVGLLSTTYSGALLGMKPLPTQLLNIRPSLAQTLYTEEELNIMRAQLSTYKLIPTDMIEYISTIHDKFEKAIYISMLYGIFSNANT